MSGQIIPREDISEDTRARPVLWMKAPLSRRRQAFVFLEVIPGRSSLGSSRRGAFHAGSSSGVISNSTICGVPFKLGNSNNKELEEAESINIHVYVEQSIRKVGKIELQCCL